MADLAKRAPAPLTAEEKARFGAVLAKANAKTITPELRTQVRAELGRRAGAGATRSSVYDLVLERACTTLPGANALKQEMVLVAALELRNDLGWQEAPAIEQLLIEHVTLCWVRLHAAEQLMTALQMEFENVKPESGRYIEARLSTAQGLYLRAVETLARVRRLAVPVLVQNNAVNQQVNIGG